jgi:hypothetical protein
VDGIGFSGMRTAAHAALRAAIPAPIRALHAVLVDVGVRAPAPTAYVVATSVRVSDDDFASQPRKAADEAHDSEAERHHVQPRRLVIARQIRAEIRDEQREHKSSCPLDHIEEDQGPKGVSRGGSPTRNLSAEHPTNLTDARLKGSGCTG